MKHLATILLLTVASTAFAGGPTECELHMVLPNNPGHVGDQVAAFYVTSFCPDTGTMTTPDGVEHDLVFDCDADGAVSQTIEYTITDTDFDMGFVVWTVEATHVSGTPQCRTGWAMTVVEGTDQLCGDVDGDGNIDVNDMLFVINEWGNPGPFGDTNDDGTVDVWDLINVICNWNGAESGCYPL